LFDGDQLLEKNSEQISNNNITIEDLEQNILNIIYYDDSFAKTRFFINIISEWGTPIFYFDFDLLYSGYMKSGIVSTAKNITLLCPDNDNLRKNIKSVMDNISKKKYLVIIDSLNGFFNLLEGKKDAGRIVNTLLMLLVSAAKNTKSIVIVGSLSKQNDKKDWVLSNTGRRVIENNHMTKIQLVESHDSDVAKILKINNSNSITLEFDSTN
jgi:hypothetical protein